MNRDQTMHAFAAYVSGYDSSDPKIYLKIKHTYKVAALCETIGRSLGLDAEDLDAAWLCGMLHDLGRFDQITKYGTFNDAQSVDHAFLSTCILFGSLKVQETERTSAISSTCMGENPGDYGPRIREFVDCPSYDDIIYTAVRYHSAYRIPDNLDERMKMFCNILRDADKLDIYRVNLETPQEEIYNVTTEQLYNCHVSPKVMEAFDEHHAILRSLKQTPIDNLAGHISLAYELVYPRSREIVAEQGYLKKMMDFQSRDPIAQVQFAHIREEMGKWLSEHV